MEHTHSWKTVILPPRTGFLGSIFPNLSGVFFRMLSIFPDSPTKISEDLFSFFFLGLSSIFPSFTEYFSDFFYIFQSFRSFSIFADFPEFCPKKGSNFLSDYEHIVTEALSSLFQIDLCPLVKA